ncbi:MarR family winged helix-turn-helix transcriptional regulator [Nonomuraea sp. NPDC049269]|uniref:MarR family winged helix-turn-helix transcriptional regulator n=1 Tax=Nonomuraea sp. NPDC049269 TaxID=3364349 RepID=UPI00371D51B8
MTVEGSLINTVGFLLGKLGQQANGQFADRLAPLGLRPRHCAVLEFLSGGPRAQLELAKAVGVTASVVVDMLDELEKLGAVRRVRDTADRRGGGGGGGPRPPARGRAPRRESGGGDAQRR